jgi:hypothetical protein
MPDQDRSIRRPLGDRRIAAEACDNQGAHYFGDGRQFRLSASRRRWTREIRNPQKGSFCSRQQARRRVHR